MLLLLQAASPAPASRPPDLSTKSGVEAEAKRYFWALDANKDGKVDRPEAEAFHNRMVALAERERRSANATFNGLDTNKDGTLSREEYLAILGTQPEAKESWLDDNDANHDGKVELGEAIRRVQITFDVVDTNHDGKLSPQERAAARSRRSAKP
jgi:hypothetical protein